MIGVIEVLVTLEGCAASVVAACIAVEPAPWGLARIASGGGGNVAELIRLSCQL